MKQRFLSFNVNSVRARMHQLKAVIDKHQPMVIGLQETKVDDSAFPIEDIQALGYHVVFHGQKSHYGVALLMKIKPLWSHKGFEHDTDEIQARLITAAFEINGKTWIVMNGYFPQGESRDHPTKFPMKARFYEDVTQQVQHYLKQTDHLILIGDMNIAPEDKDIGIGEQNAKRWLQTGKCSFLPEERVWMTHLKSQGLTDAFRYLHPDSTELSWFDYRSQGFLDNPKRGLRIDLILASRAALSLCTDAGIDYEIRGMDKPSDHCPIWVDVVY